MNNESASKRLHFIVRHDQYDQTIGYGYFLDHVLSRLNAEKPSSAMALLERTAMLMLNPTDEQKLELDPKKQEKDISVFLDSLPSEALKAQLREACTQIANIAPELKHGRRVEELTYFFGPAGEPDFGWLFPRRFTFNRKLYEDNKAEPANNRPDLQCYGGSPSTDILYPDGRSYRGYFEAIANNYGLRADNIPADFLLQFDYPIPGGSEKLALMKISSPENLVEDHKRRYSGDPQAIEDYIAASFTGSYALNGYGEKVSYPEGYKKRLIFLHPACDQAFFDNLITCIDPLLQRLEAAPKTMITAGSSPPEDKLDAMIDIYWLLAQSTPVVRGGSAYANVMLEHMAARLRAQGYDYEIPYTKEGTDLWAQAAMLPLEDKPQIKGFKSRFKEGIFFDTHAQDEDIERYLHAKLQEDDLLGQPYINPAKNTGGTRNRNTHTL